MKLHLLEGLIDQFILYELKEDPIDWYFPHSLVDHFHQTWSAPDPNHLKNIYDQSLRSEYSQRWWKRDNYRHIYDQSLRSEYSQRWWKRDNYRPKEIMILLIETDPELASIAWKDLSNESASLDGRLYRFNYYCEELLQMHRQKNERSVETYHHQDASILSLYLAGLSPEKYTLYPGLDSFLAFCKTVGSPDLPVIDDLVRYMKVTSITFTFLQRNKNYNKLMEYRRSKHIQV